MTSPGLTVDPVAGSLDLLIVQVPAMSLLTMVQVTSSPSVMLTEVTTSLPELVQVYPWEAYPSGPNSSSRSDPPGSTGTFVTAGVPLPPLKPRVGPSADRTQSDGTAVPPLSLTTVLTRVRYACWAVLVMVQVTVAADGRP